MTAAPTGLAAAEAALARFDAEAGRPALHDAAWVRAWTAELRRLEAFATGLGEGRGAATGLFLGFGAWMRAVRATRDALALHRRIRHAADHLEALSLARS